MVKYFSGLEEISCDKDTLLKVALFNHLKSKCTSLDKDKFQTMMKFIWEGKIEGSRGNLLNKLLKDIKIKLKLKTELNIDKIIVDEWFSEYVDYKYIYQGKSFHPIKLDPISAIFYDFHHYSLFEARKNFD